MNGLMKSAGTAILINMLKQRLNPVKTQVDTHVKMLAGVLFLIGFALIITAEYQWLLTLYPSAIATLLTGLTLICLSALAYVFISIKQARKEKAIKKNMPSMDDIKHTLGDIANDDVISLIKENPSAAVAISAAAGVLAGRNI